LPEYAKRFPLLEHLSWSHLPELEHHLSGSAIPVPPKDIFDPEQGPLMLAALGAGEKHMSELVAARYGVPFERVLLAAGLSEGLFLVASSVIEPGDFALVETPGYQSLGGVAHACGAIVRPLPRGLDGSLAPEAATQAIARTAEEARAAGKKLAVILVADLNNPTSARLSDATIDALAEGARRAGAVLVIDEVYRDADAGRTTGTAQTRHPDIVTLSSVTKAYGFGGLRSGWLLAPAELREACSRVKLYLSVDPSGPATGIAIGILGAADRILNWARPILEENRQTLTAALSDRPSGFMLPSGASVGTTAFVYRPNGPDTYDETVAWRKKNISVVPGRWFGAPSGMRMGLGRAPHLFRKSIEAWMQALGEPART